MIGFFDSGLWWLTVLREFHRLYGNTDFVYFGDTANCPYGDLSAESVLEHTRRGVETLFEHGAKIVILACNTATAHAIRPLQQTYFPERKILGVTIPGAEKIVDSGYKKVGVLATEGSIKIRAYKERVRILSDEVEVQEIAASNLVPLIEKGEWDSPELRDRLKDYLAFFDQDIEAIVLGCTHYPIVAHHVQDFSDLPIIDPGYESAKSFGGYLERHPELELGHGGKRIFLTSGNPLDFSRLASELLGERIEAKQVVPSQRA